MKKIVRPLEELEDELHLMRVPFVALVYDVLDERECTELIARIETAGMEAATITLGANHFELRPNTRNNDRAIFDDVPLATLLFERMRDAFPATWEVEAMIDGRGRVVDADAVAMNERFRAYRYVTGQRFAPHFDGCYRRNDRECSEITVLVYLNEGCDGGETVLLDYGVRVVPKRGMALLFQHTMYHEGRPVLSGVKYVLRTDVMYLVPGG
jgi:predicted 2-oxoglutarate/Fe(II)-dependent dioxygenase YbiX